MGSTVSCCTHKYITNDKKTDEIKNCSFSVTKALKVSNVIRVLRCDGDTKVVNEERPLLDANSNKDRINNEFALKIKELEHQLKVKDDLMKNYKNNYEEKLNKIISKM